MKIVGICGEPGTGKTTVMREIIQSIGLWENFKFGTLEYMRHKESGIIILGKYNGEIFDGTDKLSMSVINDTEKFIIQVSAPQTRILFEGDRLWCSRFIQTCMTIDTDFKFIRLYCGVTQFVERHIQRENQGFHQDTSFITGRKTKYDNLAKQFPFFERMVNNNHADLLKITEYIVQYLDWNHAGSIWLKK